MLKQTSRARGSLSLILSITRKEMAPSENPKHRNKYEKIVQERELRDQNNTKGQYRFRPSLQVQAVSHERDQGRVASETGGAVQTRSEGIGERVALCEE
jgi:hypothetical protein